MLIGMLATGLAVAAPEFNEVAELRRSNCDVGDLNEDSGIAD
jgi:hypothetical protein